MTAHKTYNVKLTPEQHAALLQAGHFALAKNEKLSRRQESDLKAGLIALTVPTRQYKEVQR